MNNTANDTSNILTKSKWPRTPQMQLAWWGILCAVDSGSTKTPAAIEYMNQNYEQLLENGVFSGKRFGRIAQTLLKRGIISADYGCKKVGTTYSLTEFGQYCMSKYKASGSKKPFIVTTGDNLSPKTKTKKALPVIEKSKLSGWLAFATRQLIPTNRNDYAANVQLSLF